MKEECSITRVKAAEGEGGQCLKNQAQNEKLTIILETLKQFPCLLIGNKITELTLMYPRQDRRSAEGLLYTEIWITGGGGD